MSKITLLAAVSALICALASANPLYTDRIVGGYEASIEDFPYQISLQLRGSHYCGGSILSETWIMTAAHCTEGRTAKDYTVRYGSERHASGGEIVPVKTIYNHKQYDGARLNYDYALIELSEPIKLSAKAKIIALPKAGESILDGTNCLISGWGNTQSASESTAKLRAAEVPTVNQEKCVDAYKATNPVTPQMLCAGFEQGGKDACQGDSGGPMVCNGKLHGVVSWGLGCARPKYPGVYSRILAVRDWVKETSGL